MAKYFIKPDVVYGFTAALLHSRFDNPKPTPECHLEWWDLMCRDHPYAALAAPRGHAKSTCTTHSFALACICFKVKQHILIVSDTEGQAKIFLGDIAIELQENEDLVKTFGFKRFVKLSETEIIGEFDDGHKFRVIAKGSEQKVRGIKWRNMRPDLILCDDLENDEIVLNEERRHKFRQWFRNALLPCGSDTCHYRVVGTILSLDSLLERLMPPKDHPETKVEPLREWNYDTRRQWISARYRAHPSLDDFSAILWESQFPEARLKKIRQGFLDDQIPDGYAQEYLNEPIDPSTAMFQSKDFIPMTAEDKKLPKNYYISADLAISEKKQRARSAFCVAGMDSNGVLHYEHMLAIKNADAYTLVDTLFSLVSMYDPEMVIIEKENIATTLLGMIKKEMEERGIYFRLETPTPTKDKVARARPLQLRMKAGKVKFDTDSDWFSSFHEEAIYFPRGRYKDRVDAASWIPYMLQNLVAAPTREEIEAAEYEDEIEESYSFYDLGASRITGY